MTSRVFVTTTKGFGSIWRMLFLSWGRECQKGIRGVAPWVIEVFESYSWPGNIRELENLIERAYILETSSTLTPESFPAELFGDGMRPSVPSSAHPRTLADGRREAVEDFERDYIRNLLAKHKGRINKSAEEADISTRQLHKLLLKYGIRKEPFKV
jgi:DNA-binding NtrC family response regulator